MRHIRHIIYGALATAAIMAPKANAQTFASRSVLADGKWTKVSVEATGLYEISYSQLREMGFSDPSKVAVYGQGGRMYSEDLLDSKGKQVYLDDLVPTPVLHEKDKLYFYGLGLDDIEFTNQYGYQYFDNGGLNIYTDKGYYFLTDSAPAKEIEKVSAKPADLQESLLLTEGLWHTYHEVDLAQGHKHNGRIFWGEDFSSSGVARMEWDAELRDPILGKSGILAVDMYKDHTDALKLTYGYTSGTGGFNGRFPKSDQQLYFEPGKPRYAVVTPTSAENKVYIEASDRPGEPVRLDYWVLTYRRGIPTLGNVSQDAILFDEINAGDNRNIVINSVDNRRVLQISDPYDITEYEVNDFGPEGRVNFTAATDNPTLLIFNPSKKQLEIGGYEDVENQDLHGLASSGADLAIICTDETKEFAEQHADIHRRIQGLKVIVTDVATLYNEFSGGRPDPMAYRAFVSMLHKNRVRPLKNVLLYGHASGDIRSNVKAGYGNSRILIPHDRKNRMAFDHGASSIFDFCGITENTISNQFFENLPVSVGVGVLTVQNATDARIMREKVERYLTDDSHAYYLNRILAIGCDGDNHSHEEQAVLAAKAYNEANYDANIATTIFVDDSGNDNTVKQLTTALNGGVSVFQYLGHSGPTGIGYNSFFTSGMIPQLKNKYLPFIGFAGCDLTLPDRSLRGIAERIVLDTEHGGIACMATNRQAWSGPNGELTNAFLRKWGWADGSPSRRLEEPQTLGELYARTKTAMKQSNELAYFLIGDPAVVLPSVNRKVEMEIATSGKENLTVGYNATISGKVTRHDGTIDDKFNGEAVIRVMEPELKMRSRSFNAHETTSYPITRGDFQAVMAVAKVKNGKFTTEVRVPEYMSKFNGKKSRITGTVYDRDRRLGGAGVDTLTIVSALEAGLPEPAKDNEPPVVLSFVYDSDTHMLKAEVADDVALSTANSPRRRPSTLLSIDGKTEECDRSAMFKATESGNGNLIEFTLPELDYGDHTAVIEVSDQSDNRTTAECRFRVNPEWAKLTLTTKEEIADGKITFNIEGALDNVLTLFILDNDGNEVYRESASGDEIVWNCKDNNSNRVAPGLYKAFVRESGKPGYRAHSATIKVPVI